MRFIMTCGIFGILILLAAFALLVAWVVLICIARSRKPMLIFALAALLPLLIGIAGTATGYAAANRAASIDVPPNVAQQGRAVARRAIYLGGGASAVLWALTLVGIAVKRNSKGQS